MVNALWTTTVILLITVNQPRNSDIHGYYLFRSLFHHIRELQLRERYILRVMPSMPSCLLGVFLLPLLAFFRCFVTISPITKGTTSTQPPDVDSELDCRGKPLR